MSYRRSFQSKYGLDTRSLLLNRYVARMCSKNLIPDDSQSRMRALLLAIGDVAPELRKDIDEFAQSIDLELTEEESTNVIQFPSERAASVGHQPSKSSNEP